MKRLTMLALIILVCLSFGGRTKSAEKESDFYKRKPIQNINTDYVEQWVSSGEAPGYPEKQTGC